MTDKVHLCQALTISFNICRFHTATTTLGRGTAVEVKYCSGKPYHHTKIDDHTLHGTNINATQVGYTETKKK
jgi:hypothetical protein